jgi:hypothetical protein
MRPQARRPPACCSEESYITDLLLEAPSPVKEQPTTDYVTDFLERLYDIHHFARQHLKVAYTGLRFVMTT